MERSCTPTVAWCSCRHALPISATGQRLGCTAGQRVLAGVFLRVSPGHGGGPALQVLLGDAAQGANPRVGVVQARDMVELLATVGSPNALPC